MGTRSKPETQASEPRIVSARTGQAIMQVLMQPLGHNRAERRKMLSLFRQHKKQITKFGLQGRFKLVHRIIRRFVSRDGRSVSIKLGKLV